MVTKKALAYVESIITTACVHLMKGAKVEGNPVQAYLCTLSLPRILDLQREVDAALEQCEDSSKHMAVYRGGVDLAQRIRAQSFSKDGPLALRPHKATDSLHRLHERLGCHKQHPIPIGFFYAKWSEKLHFHLSKLRKQERSHSSASSSRSRTPSPKGAPTSTRSAGDPLRRPISPEPNNYPALHPKARKYHMEKDAAAREARLKEESRSSYGPKIASSSAAGVDMSIETAEDNLNDLRLRSEEHLESLLEEHKKSIGYGPAG